MAKPKRKIGVLLAHAEMRGFDQSEIVTRDRGMFVRAYVHIGCSQCDALVINGVACHETGCPNATHECRECETLIPMRDRLCESCANPEAYDDDTDRDWDDDTIDA